MIGRQPGGCQRASRWPPWPSGGREPPTAFMGAFPLPGGALAASLPPSCHSFYSFPFLNLSLSLTMQSCRGLSSPLRALTALRWPSLASLPAFIGFPLLSLSFSLIGFREHFDLNGQTALVCHQYDSACPKSSSSD